MPGEVQALWTPQQLHRARVAGQPSCDGTQTGMPREAPPRKELALSPLPFATSVLGVWLPLAAPRLLVSSASTSCSLSLPSLYSQFLVSKLLPEILSMVCLLSGAWTAMTTRLEG